MPSVWAQVWQNGTFCQSRSIHNHYIEPCSWYMAWLFKSSLAWVVHKKRRNLVVVSYQTHDLPQRWWMAGALWTWRNISTSLLNDVRSTNDCNCRGCKIEKSWKYCQQIQVRLNVQKDRIATFLIALTKGDKLKSPFIVSFCYSAWTITKHFHFSKFVYPSSISNPFEIHTSRNVYNFIGDNPFESMKLFVIPGANMLNKGLCSSFCKRVSLTFNWHVHNSHKVLQAKSFSTMLKWKYKTFATVLQCTMTDHDIIYP